MNRKENFWNSLDLTKKHPDEIILKLRIHKKTPQE